jgi:hypothetical protein
MRSEAVTDEAVLVKPAKGARPGLQLGKAMTRYCGGAIVAALAIVLWAPRLSGPIDLRWDAGVYYLLGTSLATGHGYKILSEPGSPEALQYPPLLPAVIALYERALGTTDPAVVAPWLRKSYAALFVAYGLAVLALARRHLASGFAIAAAALCLLHFETIFLSDLLFAELPFALLSIIFVLVLTNGPATRPWVRELFSFVLAAAGFLLRTAGVALLGAWVVEALAHRRWRLAILRALLALVPVVAWQEYVVRVRASDQYSHPAYEYQRASYQYYNVSYVENMHLIDPFRPELGQLTATGFARRFVTNLPSVVSALGEAISARESGLARVFEKAQHKLLHRSIIPGAVMFLPILILAALVLWGIVLLGLRGAWLMFCIILISIALVLTTPWPAQFTRYLVPLGGFLSISAFLALSQIRAATRGWARGASNKLARVTIPAIVVLAFGVEAYPSLKLFRSRASAEGMTVEPGGSAGSRLFAHDPFWQSWERTVNWLGVHAPREAIVATSAPHWLYLRTGLRAVLPPMESDPGRAERLLESIPVSYVIIDQLEFLDISRRYARPALKGGPRRWRLVYSIDGTKTYERIRGAE